MSDVYAQMADLIPLAQSNAVPVVGVLVFSSVFLFVLLLTRGYVARDGVRRRAIAGLTSGAEAHLDDPRSIQHQGLAESAQILQRTAGFSSEGKSHSKTRIELVKAGFFSPNSVFYFHAARILLSILLPLTVFVSVTALEVQVAPIVLLAIVVGMALFGLILPGVYVGKRQRTMYRTYQHGFPDFMDLLIVCVEAGLGLDAAIEKVSGELVGSHPCLAANIHLVSLELRAGKPLSETMAALSIRTGIEEVQSLGGLLKQSEELGTSLAAALRVYSDEMRDKRFSRAEERAHALPVKLVLPLGLFIFPVLMLLILLPMVIRMQAAFV